MALKRELMVINDPQTLALQEAPVVDGFKYLSLEDHVQQCIVYTMYRQKLFTKRYGNEIGSMKDIMKENDKEAKKAYKAREVLRNNVDNIDVVCRYYWENPSNLENDHEDPRIFNGHWTSLNQFVLMVSGKNKNFIIDMFAEYAEDAGLVVDGIEL